MEADRPIHNPQTSQDQGRTLIVINGTGTGAETTFKRIVAVNNPVSIAGKRPLVILEITCFKPLKILPYSQREVQAGIQSWLRIQSQLKVNPISRLYRLFDSDLKYHLPLTAGWKCR